MVVYGAFQTFLLGAKWVNFYTDSRNLLNWQTAKWSAVEQRWVAQMSMFNFELHCKPGKENEHADFLCGEIQSIV